MVADLKRYPSESVGPGAYYARKCDEDRRPGTGSRLYYISSWVMRWPTDPPKKPVTG